MMPAHIMILPLHIYYVAWPLPRPMGKMALDLTYLGQFILAELCLFGLDGFQRCDRRGVCCKNSEKATTTDWGSSFFVVTIAY